MRFNLNFKIEGQSPTQYRLVREGNQKEKDLNKDQPPFEDDDVNGAINRLQEITREIDRLQREFDDQKNIIAKRKGKKGAELIATQIRKGPRKRETDQEEKVDFLKRWLADLQKEREKAELMLLEKGIFQKFKETGETYIVDLDKFKDTVTSKFLKENFQSIYAGRFLGDNKMLSTLYYLFSDLQVISKEDFDKGIRETRQFIYSPESKEEAFDIEKIKSAKFYLTYFDLIPKFGRYTDVKYPPIEDIDIRELILAIGIYHPDGLNGFRDDEGKLMIKVGDKYVPVTQQRLLDCFGSLGPTKRGESLASSSLFVNNHLSNLKERELLLPSDFKSKAQTMEAMSVRTIYNITQDGVVTLGGLRYNVGRTYKGKKVLVINYDLAVVIDDNSQIKATFKLQDKNEIDQRRGKIEKYSKRAPHRISQKELNLNLNLSPVFPQKPGERDQVYQERVLSFETVQPLIDFYNRNSQLLKENDLHILNFDLKIQYLMIELEEGLGEANFKQFIDKYRKEGLNSTLALEYDQGLMTHFEAAAQETDQGKIHNIWSVFSRFNSLIRILLNLDEEIEKNIGDDESDKIDKNELYFKFLESASNLLKSYFEDPLIDKVQSNEEMKQEEDYLLFLKNLLDSGFKPQELLRVRHKIKDYGERYDEGEVGQVIDMIDKNWNQVEALRPVVLASARENFQNISEKIESQKTHLFKFKGKVAAVVNFTRKRMKDGEDIVIANTLNVYPTIRGGSFGKLALQEGLLREARRTELYATVHPSLLAGMHYVEKIKFDIIGIIPDYHETGEPLFVIKLKKGKDEDRDPKNNADHEDIIERFESDKSLDEQIGDDEIVRKYDFPDDYARLVQETNQLLQPYDDNFEKVEEESAPVYEIKRYFQYPKEEIGEDGKHTRWIEFKKAA
jgi:hypothetical protein